LLQNTMPHTINVVPFAHERSTWWKIPLRRPWKIRLRTIHEHSEQARSELRSGGDIQQTEKQVHGSRRKEQRRVFTQRVHQHQ